MAEEQSSLIPRKTSSISSSLFCCKTYQSSWVHSKGAIIVLIWTSVITISTYILLNATIQLDAVSIWAKVPIQSFIFFFFPVLGYLGEKWTRYKVITVSVSIMATTYVMSLILLIIIVTLDVHHGIRSTIEYLYTVTTLIILFGFGLFISNIIQFGTDQLQFAPSHHLAAFSHWFVCVFLFSFVIPVVASGAIKFNFIYYGICCFCFALLVGFAITFGCCCKHHFTIEPSAHIDPVKMIWRVMKYAWKHKYPVRRSAFTYSDGPPSRLDLAKERYGGPFTTEQVEDVKSFWNILVVFLPSITHALPSTLGVAKQYVNIMGTNNTITDAFLPNIVLHYPNSIEYLVTVISIIILQLVIVPFFSCYIPSMLKRMWIGLVFILFSSITLTVISAALNNSLQELNHTSFCGEHYHTSNITSLWPYYVLIIPQLLSGVGLSLNFMSNLEFILAQSPHYMQGTLIGMLFLQTAVGGLNDVISISTPVGCYCEYYAVISGIVFISLIIYSIVAYRYKYRQRNEISDINVRINIEDIYERNLKREAREQDENDDTEYLIQSIN